MTPRADIRLLTVAEAAEYLGNVRPQALRTEIRKGNLTPVRIAGKDYVTEADLEGLIRKCRVAAKPNRPACISGGGADGDRGGLSSTGEPKPRPDVLKATANKLKRLSPTTSKTCTARQAGQIVPIK